MFNFCKKRVLEVVCRLLLLYACFQTLRPKLIVVVRADGGHVMHFNISAGDVCSLQQKNCKQIFNSRNGKSGIFDTSSLFTATIPAVNVVPVSSIFPGRVQCRYEFQGEPFERIQIKFLEFNIPTEKSNSTNCSAMESLQLLEEVYGRHEVVEQYCGNNFPRPLMSSGHKLQMQFVGIYPLHDTKPSNYGFKAEYMFLKDFGIRTGEQQNNDCSFSYKSVVQRSGWFASPNFPGYYPKNLFCSYFFYGELEERVSVRFTYFDVEGIGTCDFLTASDYVEFSNFLSTDRKFTRFCGKRNAFEVKSDGRFFRISFYSNDRFEKTGFRALYDFERNHGLNENSSVSSFVFNGYKGLHLNIFPLINLNLAFNYLIYMLHK